MPPGGPSKIPLSRADALEYSNRALVNACRGDTLEGVKWLREHFKYTREDFRAALSKGAFLYSKGNLALARWLVETFKPTPADFLHDNGAELRAARVMTKTSNSARWPYQSAELAGPQNHFSKIHLGDRRVHEVRAKGRLETLEWLHATFGLTKADVFPGIGAYSCVTSPAARHLAVARWLVERLGVSQAAIPGRRLKRRAAKYVRRVREENTRGYDTDAFDSGLAFGYASSPRATTTRR
jgi:hypothetical protein